MLQEQNTNVQKKHEEKKLSVVNILVTTGNPFTIRIFQQ